MVFPIPCNTVGSNPQISQVHVANMGPTLVLLAPGGLYVGPMSLAIRVPTHNYEQWYLLYFLSNSKLQNQLDETIDSVASKSQDYVYE